MLQYLLNITAIWAISLLVFDVFLRRESYHAYNRGYLMATVLMGILLPLCQWPQKASNSYVTALRQPVARMITTGQHIAGAPVHNMPLSWPQIFAAIYIAGALIALCATMIDVKKLINLFKGNKTTQGNLSIIETGKAHAPFSFRNTLFISSRAQYSNEEWQMIVAHENRHSRLHHLADLLLLQAVLIIFWFHPLIYIYHKRLLMVHEYQADIVAADGREKYGRFLVEQSILGTAPILAHSFNRSPIKNRLIMLSRKSSAAAKSKMLLLLPLAILFASSFTKHDGTGKFEKQGDAYIRKGNIVELSKASTDTVTVMDPVSGHEDTVVAMMTPKPVKLNNKEIREESLNASTSRQYFTYLLAGLKPLLAKLDDGRYQVSPDYTIINGQGELACYRTVGIVEYMVGPQPAQIKPIDTTLRKEINEKTKQLLDDCPKIAQLTVGGHGMPYSIGCLYVNVKQHQVTTE